VRSDAPEARSKRAASTIRCAIHDAPDHRGEFALRSRQQRLHQQPTRKYRWVVPARSGGPQVGFDPQPDGTARLPDGTMPRALTLLTEPTAPKVSGASSVVAVEARTVRPMRQRCEGFLSLRRHPSTNRRDSPYFDPPFVDNITVQILGVQLRVRARRRYADGVSYMARSCADVEREIIPRSRACSRGRSPNREQPGLEAALPASSDTGGGEDGSDCRTTRVCGTTRWARRRVATLSTPG